MFGTCFRAACSHAANSRGIHKAFGGYIDGTVCTMATLSFDRLSASGTDVLRFRLFYFGHVAALDFTLVPLSEACGYPLPSKS